MTLFSALLRLLLLAPLALALSGCYPEGPVDEERDPHFLAGKRCLLSMDYDGAIAAFENALASNPKSAAAHRELGWLYEERKNDYGAAIYHLQRHLELRPDSNMAESVKQHIFFCKLELAKTVPFTQVNRQLQQEMGKISATNALLHERVEELKAQMIEQATLFSNRLAQANQAISLAQSQPQPSKEPDRRAPPVERFSPPSPPAPVNRTNPLPRSHVVRSGETLAAVAKRYNIKLSALQNANPTIDARKLKAGQALILPASRN
jgi:LysM repeat protein